MIDDEEAGPGAGYLDHNVVHWPANLAPAVSSRAQRRADEAKNKRLDAQEALLGLFPEAVSYLRMVLIGQVAPDADRLKVALKLADKILPNLQAVAVQGQVLGVDQEDIGKQGRAANYLLDIMAEVSKDCSAREEADRQRRRLEAQGANCAEGAVIEGTATPASPVPDRQTYGQEE